MIESSLAIFPILLIFIDILGIWQYWQIYILIVPIVNLGWALNYSILKYGITVFDGGVGQTVFLFSGVVTLAIWAVSVRGKFDRLLTNKQDNTHDGLWSRK